MVLFVPNRGYPFETHGIYWRGKYHFGNIPLVNYLPRRWRDRLAPHVRVYSERDLEKLFRRPAGALYRAHGHLRRVRQHHRPLWRAGRFLRALLQLLERTPLRGLGLSHFWVVEKV